jgi:hypothetical protein
MKLTCLKEIQRIRKMSLRGVRHRRTTKQTQRMSLLHPDLSGFAMTGIGAFSSEKDINR